MRAAEKHKREEFLANVGFIRHRQWDEILAGSRYYRARTRDGRDLGFVVDWGEVWAAEGEMGGAGGFPTRDAAVLWLGGFK